MKNKKDLPDLNYIPSVEWKKADPFSAEAEDGSRVVLDIRGLVHYVRPDDYYLNFGHGEEPHNKSFGPPLKNKPLFLYVKKRIDLRKDGYDTGCILNQKQTKLYVMSMKEALEKIGYKVKIMGVREEKRRNKI